jgi:hypothetical protein
MTVKIQIYDSFDFHSLKIVIKNKNFFLLQGIDFFDKVIDCWKENND